MSGLRRRRKKSAGRSGAPAPASTRRRGRSRRWLVVGIALAIVAGGALVWGFGRESKEHPIGGDDVARDRSAAEYLRVALAAEQAWDYDSAFTLYLEALRRYPNDLALWGSYASALNNRSFVVRPNRGKSVALDATSHERVQDALASLAQFDAMERAAPRYGEAALQRGLLYAAWGLPEDGLAELYRAHVLGGREDKINWAGTMITLLQLGRGDSLESDRQGRLGQNGNPASR